jgi:hypothetical protein
MYGAFFLGTRQSVSPGVIVGKPCCKNRNRGYCLNTLRKDTNRGNCCNCGKSLFLEHVTQGYEQRQLLQQLEQKSLLWHIVATVGTKVIVGFTVTSDYTPVITLDTNVIFVIPLEQERSKFTISLNRGYERSNLMTSLPVLCVKNTFGSVLQKAQLSTLD